MDNKDLNLKSLLSRACDEETTVKIDTKKYVFSSYFEFMEFTFRRLYANGTVEITLEK